MQFKKILILGSSGQIGRRVCNLLLVNTNSHLVMADINNSQIDVQKTNFVKNHPHRTQAIFLDASDPRSLITAFKDVDLIIIASSTIKYTKNIVEAAFINKCNLIDLQGPCQEKANIIKSYNKKFVTSQKFLVTEAGAWPGLPLTMITYSSKFFDTLSSVEIFGFFNIDWNNTQLAKSTMLEADKFYAENEKIPSVCKIEKWYATEEYGSKDHYIKNVIVKFKPTYTNELIAIKERFKNLEEFGFYINFGHPDVEKITLFECVCVGTKDKKKLISKFIISTAMGYDLTAAATLSILENNLRSGAIMMGELDSDSFIQSLKKYHMQIELSFK